MVAFHRYTHIISPFYSFLQRIIYRLPLFHEKKKVKDWDSANLDFNKAIKSFKVMCMFLFNEYINNILEEASTESIAWGLPLHKKERELKENYGLRFIKHQLLSQVCLQFSLGKFT